MASAKEPLITLESITKEFPGVLALDGVSLSIYPGEVHAVIGENGAGKSTLMNILAGELQPDGGRILSRGQETVISDAGVSQKLGISVVYQELALCPNLSVAENISLNRVGSGLGVRPLDRKRFRQRAATVMAQLGMGHMALSRPVSQLSVAQQQLVEIARAISAEAEVLILDEPNSALTVDETEALFRVLRQLRESGVAIIYISHRLEEVLSLADRITVLRDGKLIETVETGAVDIPYLIERMVGRVVDELFHRDGGSRAQSQSAFELQGLSDGELLDGISFQVRAGEVLGIAGLPDAGKDELVECCFGLRPYRGEIRVRGEPVTLRSPSDAITHGIAFVPADRRQAGALLVMDVKENIVVANLSAVSRTGWLNQSAIRRHGSSYVQKLDIRISSLKQRMSTLSGGNQQKVILARGLATNPTIFLVHEPTRGIDVGAKAEIYSIVQELAAGGVAIIIVSSELPELMSQCDRILVMYRGAITGHFERDEADEASILACAMGQATHL